MKIALHFDDLTFNLEIAPNENNYLMDFSIINSANAHFNYNQENSSITRADLLSANILLQKYQTLPTSQPLDNLYICGFQEKIFLKIFLYTNDNLLTDTSLTFALTAHQIDILNTYFQYLLNYINLPDESLLT